MRKKAVFPVVNVPFSADKRYVYHLKTRPFQCFVNILYRHNDVFALFFSISSENHDRIHISFCTSCDGFSWQNVKYVQYLDTLFLTVFTMFNKNIILSDTGNQKKTLPLHSKSVRQAQPQMPLPDIMFL